MHNVCINNRKHPVQKYPGKFFHEEYNSFARCKRIERERETPPFVRGVFHRVLSRSGFKPRRLPAIPSSREKYPSETGEGMER